VTRKKNQNRKNTKSKKRKKKRKIRMKRVVVMIPVIQDGLFFFVIPLLINDHLATQSRSVISNESFSPNSF
jgi:hypothetical protein